ncbi:hypothetical protein COY90_05365 [Candidatus Roizmanbacteria bacterium CG_4_10_14_0_8_um_filter_39_9]|uniref:Uncharacterized protein n=1 Tax=Candidatus Roizmanbacteria bacterium CG_4_10_14_0_8_um_filter_39_9 TaxID=1974829 RepID=A0A2M7QBF0_9BACT|nr:MAG: hypothetical protein COY90_05365 [Candidatus Roizmanbacteria bacterium CG_4_10_14_0_8_um_filter_39_9]
MHIESRVGDPFKDNSIPVSLKDAINHILTKQHIRWANTMPNDIDWGKVEKGLLQAFTKFGQDGQFPFGNDVLIISPFSFMNDYSGQSHQNNLGLILSSPETDEPNPRGYMGYIDLTSTHKLVRRISNNFRDGVYSFSYHPLVGIMPGGKMYMRLHEEDDYQTRGNKRSIAPLAGMPRLRGGS